jgi:hypothetical protein
MIEDESNWTRTNYVRNPCTIVSCCERAVPASGNGILVTEILDQRNVYGRGSNIINSVMPYFFGSPSGKGNNLWKE